MKACRHQHHPKQKLAPGSIITSPYAYARTYSTYLYTHSYKEQQGQRSGQKADKKRVEEGGCVRANKKVRMD